MSDIDIWKIIFETLKWGFIIGALFAILDRVLKGRKK